MGTGRLSSVPPGDAREPLLPLLSLADDAADHVLAHLDAGDLLTWTPAMIETVVGAVQAVPRTPSIWELTLVAVDPGHQRRGHGSSMVKAVVDRLETLGARRIVVGTASAGTDQLRFYQRSGFRVFAVEQDHFDAARGYDGSETEHGIVIRDLIWLDRLLP